MCELVETDIDTNPGVLVLFNTWELYYSLIIEASN